LSAEDLVKLLREKKLTIATAESLTAGLISSELAEVAGVSKAFKGGAVAYQNEMKVSILGVSKETLQKYGAVSSQVAQEMAQGALEKFSAACAVSSTGIAGPDTVEDKPVGLVFIGFADQGGVVSKELNLSGNRAQIRRLTAAAAIEFALENLQNR
jgi:PncC family amidohydrolase